MATTSAHHQWTFDVFVSFRGEDIRKSFMDHLFKDFGRKGIHAFRDNNDVSLGENISPQLDKVIEESRFLIVIFSKNYASSSWCLRELVKILECMEIGEHKHEVRTIFYDVKPEVVRKQTESYAEAFTKHETSNRTEVAKWKEALSMAANLSGWDLQDMANGFESKFIDMISNEIHERLRRKPLHVGKNLVGVDARVNEMNLMRFIGSRKVHMIGICGISGIGKTTLAKAIYNSISIHFEECSFCYCGNAQGVTLTHIQMQLIDDIMKARDVDIPSVTEGIMVIKKRMPAKPILFVLDDVDHREQLEALAGSPDWFFPGSLIIFTGKDKELLRSHKIEEIHDMQFLQDHEAYELFSLCAFREENIAEDFKELAYQVVKYLQGHPLALTVYAASLYGTTIHKWMSLVDMLQKEPHEDIQKVLRPSFDGLNFFQRSIFLDIACSFIGENIDFVSSVLDNDDGFARRDIDALVDKSLITISGDGNSLQMHELIRSMAREIVREESNWPGARSRLWNLLDIYKVLRSNVATEAIEVLDLLLEESSQKVHIDGKDFAHMKNLRILKICHRELEDFCWSFESNLWKDSKATYSGRLEFLSNKLRLLYWHGCPFEFFPSTFYPENIVAIDLSYSHIRNIWTSCQCFRRLKVMKLRHCRNLTSTPDFTRITDLEELIIEGCVNLFKFHPSFGMLRKLVVLNMKDCKHFRSFPTKVEMASLEVLNLSGCSKVKKFPEFFDTIQTLKEFHIDGTAIMKLPSFVFAQRNLRVLKFGRHEKMQDPQGLVMPSLARLCFLRELDFSNRNIIQVPDSIGRLSCLESLLLDGNNFTSIPGWLSELYRLQRFGLSGCKNLQVLPELPPNLSSLDANNCTSLHKLPRLFNPNHSFITFNFIGCPNLFTSLAIETHLSMLQLQTVNSSIISHSSRDQFSSFLRHMNFPSNTCGIFGAQGRRLWCNNVDIIFHGNRIPQLFTNQSIGNHVKVELPGDWCNNKFRGFGICVVLTPKKFYSSIHDYSMPMYTVKNFDGDCLVDHDPYYLKESEDDSIGIHESDMIWFHFTTEGFGWMEAKNFVTFSFENNDDVEVKECGVRLVCDEDIQEEMDLSIIRGLPTPTQDGGVFSQSGNSFDIKWSW